MAIQSAWVLCELLIPRRAELVAGRAADEVGCRYAARWRHSFTARIRIAALFAHLLMRPRATSALLPLLRRWPGILTASARLGAKVHQVTRADGRPLQQECANSR
jgi:hypothetical protein